MSVSAIETVRGQFKTALETITIANGHRNDLKEVKEYLDAVIGECPAITILFNGKVKFESKDSGCRAWDIYVPFTLVCDVEADTDTGTTSDLVLSKDSLLHDVTRVLVSKYMDQVAATLKWNVLIKDGIQSTDVFPIKDNKNKGSFDVYGTIHIHTQTVDL